MRPASGADSLFSGSFSLAPNPKTPVSAADPGIDSDIAPVNSVSEIPAAQNSVQSAVPLLASKANGYDFTLTGTGQPSSDTGFALSGSNDLDRYQIDDNGNQRIIAPNQPVSTEPISISAAYGWKGTGEGDTEIYILSGDCRITQGSDQISGPKGVLWLKNRAGAEGTEKEAEIYIEKENQWDPLILDIHSAFLSAKSTDMAWLGGLKTTGSVNLYIASPGAEQLDPEAVFRRAQVMRDKPIQVGTAANIPLTSHLADQLTPKQREEGGKYGMRRIRLLSRYDREVTISSEKDPTDPTKSRWIINGGFTLLIEGIAQDGKQVADVIDISADNAVIWAPNLEELQNNKEQYQPGELDLEIYMEGDIIFREEERIIYAKQMYYDVKNMVGLIRDTEVVMPVPDTAGGWFRINAETITQTSPDSLSAKKAWVSTSMMGEPSYRLQSDDLTGEKRTAPLYNAATGQPLIDAETGKQKTKDDYYMIAENNFVKLGKVPIFYWPWMAMDARDQSLYINRFEIANNSTLGTQVQTRWNLYQLLNCTNRPQGTDWDLDIDYLSNRGLGHGTTFSYQRDSIFGCPSPAIGMFNFYGISDRGKDNLGLGRRDLTYPNSYRYRAVWKHRQMFSMPGCLGDGWTATAQLGTSSDRNYIPQYFEEEWFTQSNPETSIEIKKTEENRSLGMLVDTRLNSFYTNTNWLPKLDHYWLGQPILCGNLVWYEHTQAGYGQFRTTETPYTNQEKELFRYLDWELASNSAGNTSDDALRRSQDVFTFSTRHELDAPFELGAVKMTPYGLGEFACWSAGNEGQGVGRFYGRGGVRANLPVWKVNSDVESRTWYLNGIAHKMNFAVDGYYSKVNQDFSKLTLYEQLDDWQIQSYRRQYSVTTFSNTYSPYRDSIPVRFDERYYAIRQGLLGGNVSSPSTEIANDLTQVRFDWFNRWQTKRGPVGNRHIIDWITFDTGFSLYPQKEQNYNQTIGLTDYDFRWHVGDRFSVLSSGLFDFFNSGQKIIRGGVMTKRPGLSSLYVGVDSLNGPIHNTYLNAAVNYRMSEKWGMSLSNSYDLAEGRNVGQQLGITRIGESFVVSLSTSINQSKDDWGISLNVQPIFLFSGKQFDENVLGLGPM